MLEKVIYPLEPVSGVQYYYKQGTHNCDLGYLQIIQAALESSEIEIPKFIPMFKRKALKNDLAKMKGYGRTEENVIVGFEDLLPHKRFFSNAKALEGNSGHVEYYFNGNSLIHKRLLLFGDSFFRDSLHLLSDIFEEVIYFRCPYNIIEDIARNLSPDYIWTGNAERYLVNVPDGSLGKPYFLNYFSDRFHPKSLKPKVKYAFNVLFSGRNSLSYRKWREQLTIKITKEKLSEDGLMSIGLGDIKGKTDIDFCRDMAVRMEEKNFRCAVHLMELAYKARPSGEFIYKKLKAYEAKRSSLASEHKLYS